MPSNSKRVFNSALFGQLPIVVHMASGLLLMPTMIRHLGPRDYGIWVLVGTFLSYFGLLDMGFAKSIVRYVSRELGRSNKDEADKWISVGLFLLCAFSMIGFIALFLGAWICQYGGEDVLRIRNLLLIGASAFLLSLPSRCFAGVLQAHIRGDLVNGVEAGMGLARIAGIGSALALHASLSAFITILAVTTVVHALVITLYALRVHTGFTFQRRALSREHLMAFLDYSGFSFAAQMADLFRFRAYPVIISAFLGLSAVTPFAIGNGIRSLLDQSANKTLIAFTSLFSQIEGRYGLGTELRTAYLFAYKIATYLATFTGGLTAILGAKFITRWIGPDQDTAALLLRISLIGGVAACMQIPTVCLLFGISKHRFYALSNGVEAVLITVSAVCLAKLFGLVGIVAGASAATVFVKMVLQPLWAVRTLRIPFWSLHVKHTFPNMGRVLVFLLACWIMEEAWMKPTYGSIAVTGLVATLTYTPYILVVGFSSAERWQLRTALPFVGESRAAGLWGRDPQ